MSAVLILLAVCVILLLKYLPSIKSFIRVVQFSIKLKGPSVLELTEKLKEGKLLHWFRSLPPKYGRVFKIWLGKDFNIFLSDPDDIKVILGSNQILYKSLNYHVLDAWLGNGLLTSGGDLWHKKRKMLTPAFHFKMLGEFKQPMEVNCDILIEKLKEKSNGEAFDIYPFITLLALDIICETAMGVQINAQVESNSDYVKAVKTMCCLCHEQAFSAWKRFPFLYKLFASDYKEREQALNILHGQTRKVIDMRKKAIKASGVAALENSDETGIKNRLAFLDLLLIAQAKGVPLTDDNIQEEVDTFMFEGHDTTSSALGFAIYLLSQHKAEQQKAYEEAVNCEGKEKDTMKYLEAVIKETLRIYPSVPFYGRLLTEDIDINGLKVPAGAAIVLLAYVVHRNEEIYPEPDLFKPERFLVDENKLHPYAFVAFSAGPRNCIGQKFAMLELKCILSKLLREYEFLPVEGFEPLPLAELVTKSGNGIQVRLRKR